jgi:hypothetical protein
MSIFRVAPIKSKSDVSLFSFRKRDNATRLTGIALELGCASTDTFTSTSSLDTGKRTPEEDDSVFQQLEDGLYGTQQQPTTAPKNPTFSVRKAVDRTSSYASTDSDQYLWANDDDPLTPDTSNLQ